MRDALLGTGTAERAMVAAFAMVTLALFAALPAWRMTEAQPAVYTEAAEAFRARVDDFTQAHATGEEIDGLELVAPKPGDVPILAERFRFRPALRLTVGQTYRLHLSSVDGVHSLAVDGHEVLLVPDQVHVLTITPAKPGRLDIRCNEYCGLGHNKMRGVIAIEP